ncbi:MAG TPA: Gfo/Idh/MocA family oxidoreductase [Caldilineaceae bacterium]|nr:Gfo/Idh/MocA family oxidoreductase [Caldilineaceae bacterium]
MADLLGVGLIGCGGIAHVHLDGWRAAADLCEVRALADPNPNALNALHAKIPSAKAFGDYRHLLDRQDIQVIEVLTPPGLHWQNARDALLAGKDVLVIKPLVVELRHADDLIALAQQQGVRLMAGQPLRYDAHMRKARELLLSGRIGRPTRFYSRGFMRQEWLNKATHWFANLSMSGGITIENIVHQTDAMHWLAGQVESVFGYAGTFHTVEWPGGGLPDDQISFLLRFVNGAIGVIEGGTAQPTGLPASMFEIVGTEGGITLDHGAVTVGRGVKERDGYAERYEIRSGRSEAAMIRDFLESIVNNSEAPVSAADGRYAVEICWAALQSAREGRAVHLPIDPAHYPTYEAN